MARLEKPPPLLESWLRNSLLAHTAVGFRFLFHFLNKCTEKASLDSYRAKSSPRQWSSAYPWNYSSAAGHQTNSSKKRDQRAPSWAVTIRLKV